MYCTAEEETRAYDRLISIEYGEKVKIRLKFAGKEQEDFLPYDETEDRKTRKNKLKQVLYKLLVQETGQALPWGNLTGIRPTNDCYGG